jgi:hypothetical protein
MHHTIILRIILFSLITVMSCDSKPCIQASLSLTFVDFSTAETDSIIIRTLNKGNSSLVDTVLINGNELGNQISTDSLQIFSPLPETTMRSDYNYEIVVPGAARSYSITDIVEDFENYKDKPLGCGTKDACVNRITSFKVNGTTVAGQSFDSMVYLTK